MVSNPHNRLAKWYLSFFAIIIVGFASLLFFYLRSQEWKDFNTNVSQFSKEMYEELLLFRDQIKVNPLDSVSWTPLLLRQFANSLEKELFDELLDYQLPGVGAVRIKNIKTGRVIYQSPEIISESIEFDDKFLGQIGFQHIASLETTENLPAGIGYWGKRGTDLYYFISTLYHDDRAISPDFPGSDDISLAFRFHNSVKRRGEELFVDKSDSVVAMLQKNNCWAFLYFFNQDSIVWSSKPLHRNEVFIPRQSADKSYFAEIKDGRGQPLRQYTEIHDKVPSYLYRIDVAIPTESTKNAVLYSFLSIYGSAFVLIAIAGIGGHFWTRRALRRVDEVIQSVKDIESKNMSRQIAVPVGDDEIVRLVRTFNELLDRLASAFQIQKNFIKDASHELKTPLSILMAEIESVLKYKKDAKVREKYLNMALAEIERIAHIVDDLDLLSSSDSGQIVFRKTNIRLDEVLITTLSRCQVLAAKNQIQLQVDSLEAIEYQGDEELLIRALSNIVNNAIKYSNKKKIHLSLYNQNGQAIFKVKDNGIGIPADSLLRIFDRFYRVDPSRSRQTGGSGLGLSITKSIIEIHHGTIEVQSQVGKGSTFTIKLPLNHRNSVAKQRRANYQK